MDLHLSPCRSGFHQWPSTGLTHSSAHARENYPSSHACPTSRPEDQPEEDRSDDAEYPKPLAGQSERGTSSNNRRITFLVSTVRHDGGAGSNIRDHLNKARNAFRKLNTMWKSSQYSTKTKLRLYQSYVLSTLLCGSE